jgi:hypothetical protein
MENQDVWAGCHVFVSSDLRLINSQPLTLGPKNYYSIALNDDNLSIGFPNYMAEDLSQVYPNLYAA